MKQKIKMTRTIEVDCCDMCPHNKHYWTSMCSYHYCDATEPKCRIELKYL